MLKNALKRKIFRHLSFLSPNVIVLDSVPINLSENKPILSFIVIQKVKYFILKATLKYNSQETEYFRFIDITKIKKLID